MISMRLALAVLPLLVLTACGGQEAPPTSEAPSASPSEAAETSTPIKSPESVPPIRTKTVSVVVITPNVLSQSCEALSGIYRGLHNGARVVIESSTGDVVGTGRLGAPPRRVPVPDNLCAWGAKIESTLVEGERYLARAAMRFTSPLSDEESLDLGEVLIIEA